MSTLRITNIEAKADPSSPTVDEKIKLTNSNGDILVHIDGKTSGITTIGINTTAGNIKFDQNSNVVVTGIITATKFVGTIEPTTLTVGGDLTIPDKIVHTGDTNTAIRFPAADTITAETAGSERFRIDSNGNIGIGDASPTKPLTVGTTTPVILLDDQSSRTLEIRGPSTTHNATVLTTSTHDLLLGTNNAERLRITSAGLVGINSTSPATVLDIQSTKNTDGLTITKAGTQSVFLGHNGSGNEGILVLKENGTTNVQIYAETNQNSYINSGNLGINATNPDRKLEVVDTNSNGSYPLAVSNFIDATANKGVAIDFRLTTGGNTRGELGCKWTSNSSSDGTAFYIAPNDGSTGNIERVRITSAGRMGVGTNDPNALLEVRDSENTTQGDAQIRISKGVGAAAAPATITRANTYLHLGGTEWGSSANGKYLIGLGYTNDEVGTGIPAYMGFTETNVGGYTKGDLIFGTRDNTTGTNNPTERLRITSTGAVNLSSPSNTVAAGLLNVPNGSRVSTTSGNYVTGNGGIVDMARYEMISRCITAFPNYNTAICAINGAPLYINDTRDTWDRYYNLPNYLLGTLTHDCINNSSFNITLACTMTVFMGRTSTWNAVSTSGWNLIESNTSIGPFNATTRLYVKTLAAGTHSLDNDSAMYFFSL